MQGRVLIIAGSDSGGGAGIQADIKTVTMLGGYAATAITALTAQNTQGVFGIHDVPEDFIRQQIALVMEDIGADSWKTGMLHKESVIHTVAEAYREYGKGIPLIVDPVMFAKGGAPLLQPEALGALKEQLLPLAYLVTPNIPEAEFLVEMPIRTPDEMQEAGRRILALGPKAALIKGGHLDGPEVVDILVTDQMVEKFSSERIPSSSTHGTGCTLASAIAAGLARGKSLESSVIQARDYVRQAILHAPGLGKGHGPLGHGWRLHS